MQYPATHLLLIMQNLANPLRRPGQQLAGYCMINNEFGGGRKSEVG
jgi:hypothetical protein